MEYLGKNKTILLVGLNPTNEAIEHGAVFCQTGGLWKIIEGSKLKPDGFDDIKTTTIENGKYINFADAVFGPKTKLAFVDLIPDCNKKNLKM